MQARVPSVNVLDFVNLPSTPNTQSCLLEKVTKKYIHIFIKIAYPSMADIIALEMSIDTTGEAPMFSCLHIRVKRIKIFQGDEIFPYFILYLKINHVYFHK